MHSSTHTRTNPLFLSLSYIHSAASISAAQKDNRRAYRVARGILCASGELRHRANTCHGSCVGAHAGEISKKFCGRLCIYVFVYIYGSLCCVHTHVHTLTKSHSHTPQVADVVYKVATEELKMLGKPELTTFGESETLCWGISEVRVCVCVCVCVCVLYSYA
jgi:hypothetical protein